MDIKRLSLMAVGFLVAGTLFGVDFESDLGFAPRLDGTFNAFAGGTVWYTPSLYSSLTLEYETEAEEESESADNIKTTQTTDTRSFAVDADVVGYNVFEGMFDLGLAASLEYIRFGAIEELLYDADEGFTIPATGTKSLLLTNDRSLDVLLPTVDVRSRTELDMFRLDVGGEYSPAVFVSLEQTADTEPVFPGFTDDGAVSTSGSYQSGQSFSISGSLLLNTPIIAPSLSGEYTHLPIEYEIATVGGEQSIDTLIREISFDSTVAFKVVSVFAFSPTIRVRYDRSWTEIEGADDVETTDDLLVFFGVARY